MANRPAKRPEDYCKSPHERGFRRVIQVDLDSGLYDPVFEYAAATAPDRPVQDAIRDLLLQAVAADAKDAAIRAARAQALTEVRDYCAREIWIFLRKLGENLQLTPLVGDPAGVQPGNSISADGVPPEQRAA